MTTLAPAPTRQPSRTGVYTERLRALRSRIENRVRTAGFAAQAAVAGVVFTTHMLVAYRIYGRLGYGAFDLTIFDQAIHNYARFRPPYVPVKGVYAGGGVDFLQFGDHFSPFNVLAAPAYWIIPDVRALFIVQALLYAAAAVVVHRYTRHLFGTNIALVVGLAFGLSWGLLEATAVGYHELDWMVLIVPLALRRLQLGKDRQALLVAASLLLVKEEMGFVLAVFGLLVWLRGHRRLGAAAAAVGVVWTAIVISVIVPAVSGVSNAYWSYDSLGKTPTQAVLHLILHPLSGPHLLFSTPDKMTLWLWLMAVGLGFALRSPIVLLALPSLLLRLLSDTETYSMARYHYNAPLMAILIIACVDGFARVRTRRLARADADGRALWEQATWLWTATIAAVAVIGAQVHGLAALPDPGAWSKPPFVKHVADAIGHVPRGAEVESDSAIAVLLAARTDHVVLAEPGKPHGSDWVVLGVASPVSWPWASASQVKKSLNWYLTHGYTKVFSRDDVWVLHRVGPLPAGVTSVWKD